MLSICEKKLDGIFQSVRNEMETYTVLELSSVELDKLWPDERPLSKEKVNDLKEILKLVPEEDIHFYSFLGITPVGNFINDVDGFGETIDFEVE